MKRILFLAVLGASLLLTSCSDDNSLFNEPMPIRAYETDAQIMAQFVEVDNTSGTYVLNPDKKVTTTDYVINRSREELLEVSPVNRDRFLNEMEAVNNQLFLMKRSGLVRAFVYSTLYSNTVIDVDEADSFSISKLAEDSYTRRSIASMKLENDRSNSTSFHSGSVMVMNVNAPSGSTFYLAQVTLGDQIANDAETIIVSGVKSQIPNRSYSLVTSPFLDTNKQLSGINMIGNGNVTISISQ